MHIYMYRCRYLIFFTLAVFMTLTVSNKWTDKHIKQTNLNKMKNQLHIMTFFYLFSAEIRRQRLIEKYKHLKVCILEHLCVPHSPCSHCLLSFMLIFSINPIYSLFQASGKLDSYIEKRRKRNAAKDHRFMPYARPVDSE